MSVEDAPIVVPLDGSRNAENAVPFAAFVARIYGDCPVHFLHVVDPEIVKTPDEVARAGEAFEHYAQDLAAKHGVEHFASHLVEGRSPAEAILRYESEAGARFLVIATHGRGGFHALFIGSVADKICRGARTPTFVVPGVDASPDAPRGPVLIALDGSDEAEHALSLGRDVATRIEAKVHLLRAYGVPPPVGQEFTYYAPGIVGRMAEAAKDYLDTMATSDEHKILAEGSPAVLIEAAAERFDAGLVVMGLQGKGRVQRVALGSTTDRVMHSLRRPLLIVPDPRDGGTD